MASKPISRMRPLTLGLDRGRTRGNYICAVDLDDELHRCLTERAQTPVWRLSHRDKSGGSFQRRCAVAGRLLSIYAHAKCVVTTRLHCAMPSLALGTPILFINRAVTYQFSGLIDLVRSCSAESFISGEVGFNFDNPTVNSDAYFRCAKTSSRACRNSRRIKTRVCRRFAPSYRNSHRQLRLKCDCSPKHRSSLFAVDAF